MGGGEVQVQVQSLEDPDYQRSWTLPGAIENLASYEPPFADRITGCQGAYEGWLFQIDGESNKVTICGEGMQLAVLLPCCGRSIYGVDRALDASGASLWMELEDRGELTGHASPFGLLHETDPSTGSLSTPSAVFYGDTGDTGHPGNTEHLSVQVNWDFSPPTHVVLETERQ
jgi:hypothetical protein